MERSDHVGPSHDRRTCGAGHALASFLTLHIPPFLNVHKILCFHHDFDSSNSGVCSECPQQSVANMHKEEGGTAVESALKTDTGPLTTSMYFLKPQELYLTEKPYSLRFVPPETFPRSNIALERHKDVSIVDIRSKVHQLSFEKNGFRIMQLQSKMHYDDFDDEEKIVKIYLREVANKLRDELGAKHVHIFEHTVGQSINDRLSHRGLIIWRSGSGMRYFQSRLGKPTSTISPHRWPILVCL